MRREKEDTFSSFTKDKPGTWRLLWGAGCWVTGLAKKTLPPAHSSIWPEGNRGLAAVELPEVAHQLDLSSSYAFGCFWVEAFRPAMAESQVWRMARATIGGFHGRVLKTAIPCWDFCFLWFLKNYCIFLFLQGRFLERAVCRAAENTSSRANLRFFSLEILVFSFVFQWELFKYNISAYTNTGLFVFFFFPSLKENWVKGAPWDSRRFWIKMR